MAVSQLRSLSYDLLANGYSEECNLDTGLYYLGEAAGGRTAVESFGSRIHRDSNTDVTKAKVGDSRLMIIPLVETLPTDRTTRQWQQVKIVGFIGFWLQNIYYGGLDWHTNCYKNYRAQGYFVKVTLPAGSYTGYSNRFFGTSQVRLVNP